MIHWLQPKDEASNYAKEEVPLFAMNPSEDGSRLKRSQERLNPTIKQLKPWAKVAMRSQDEQQMDINFAKELQQIFWL